MSRKFERYFHFFFLLSICSRPPPRVRLEIRFCEHPFSQFFDNFENSYINMFCAYKACFPGSYGSSRNLAGYLASFGAPPEFNLAHIWRISQNHRQWLSWRPPLLTDIRRSQRRPDFLQDISVHIPGASPGA